MSNEKCTLVNKQDYDNLRYKASRVEGLEKEVEKLKSELNETKMRLTYKKVDRVEGLEKEVEKLKSELNETKMRLTYKKVDVVDVNFTTQVFTGNPWDWDKVKSADITHVYANVSGNEVTIDGRPLEIIGKLNDKLTKQVKADIKELFDKEIDKLRDELAKEKQKNNNLMEIISLHNSKGYFGRTEKINIKKCTR